MENNTGRENNSRIEKNNTSHMRNSFKYNEHIDRVYDAFTNPLKYHNVMKTILSEINLVKGERYDEIGACCHFTCAITGSVVNLTVADSINTPFYKKIVFNGKQIKPLQFDYTMIYTLYWSTVQNATIFILDFICKLDIPEVLVEIQSHYLGVLLNKFDVYLKKNPENLFQEESVVINSNIENVWKVVTDWNLFNKCLTNMIWKCVYEGDPLEVDTILHVYLSNKNSEYHMKVIKVEILEYKRTYKLHFYAGVPKSPKQDLIFTFIKLDDDQCLLQFRHEYKQYINMKQISKNKKEKSFILKQLKESIEKKD